MRESADSVSSCVASPAERAVAVGVTRKRGRAAQPRRPVLPQAPGQADPRAERWRTGGTARTGAPRRDERAHRGEGRKTRSAASRAPSRAITAECSSLSPAGCTRRNSCGPPPKRSTRRSRASPPTPADPHRPGADAARRKADRAKHPDAKRLGGRQGRNDVPDAPCEVSVRTLRPRRQPCEEPRGAHRRGVGARCLLVALRGGTVPAAAGPAFRLGAYEVRRVAMEIEQRRVEA